jgi:2-dehydro-3-deoxyphosphooctonate aldolase (KDO 8-P synthase)
VPSSFKVGDVEVGGEKLFLIAGPCVIEGEAHAVKMAETITGVCKALRLPLIFKASYDKANRTSIKSFRGLGLAAGLRILDRIKNTINIPVLTDVHEAVDVQRVAEVADVLQIPAFLSRQTDLLVAAAKSGRAVNIKKGQFMAPWDVRHSVEKCLDAGGERVFVTERGSSFGYNNLVVDMRSLPIMRTFAPVVFDATHSVQLPSAEADGAAAHSPRKKTAAVSGGQPQFIPVLARAAVAAGVDGVFMEVHDDPKNAKSDGANALDLKKLRTVLRELMAVRKAVTAE